MPRGRSSGSIVHKLQTCSRINDADARSIEISGRFRGCRDSERLRYGLVDALTFIVGEEKCLDPLDRPANGRAELILFEGRF